MTEFLSVQLGAGVWGGVPGQQITASAVDHAFSMLF